MCDDRLAMIDVVREGLVRDLVAPEGFGLRVDWKYSKGDIDVCLEGDVEAFGYIAFRGEGVRVFVVNPVDEQDSCRIRQSVQAAQVEYCDPEFFVKVQDLVSSL